MLAKVVLTISFIEYPISRKDVLTTGKYSNEQLMNLWQDTSCFFSYIEFEEIKNGPTQILLNRFELFPGFLDYVLLNCNLFISFMIITYLYTC